MITDKSLYVQRWAAPPYLDRIFLVINQSHEFTADFGADISLGHEIVDDPEQFDYSLSYRWTSILYNIKNHQSTGPRPGAQRQTYRDSRADARVILQGQIWRVRNVSAYEIDGSVPDGRRAVRNSILNSLANVWPAEISRIHRNGGTKRFNRFRTVCNDGRAHTSQDGLEYQTKGCLKRSGHLDQNAWAIGLSQQVVLTVRARKLSTWSARTSLIPFERGNPYA